MSFLSDWMSVAAAQLLDVVLVLLTIMAGVTCVLLGALLRELFERPRQRRGMRAALEASKGEFSVPALRTALAEAGGGLPARFGKHLEDGEEHVDRALAELHARVVATLAPLSFLTRVGPMGGLVATLLPLGPALEALGDGQIGDVASHLTVAFTATVIGLVVSCVAYGIALLRRTWYARDLAELETLSLRIAEQIEGAA